MEMLAEGSAVEAAAAAGGSRQADGEKDEQREREGGEQRERERETKQADRQGRKVINDWPAADISHMVPQHQHHRDHCSIIQVPMP